MLPFKEDFKETVKVNGRLPTSSLKKKLKIMEKLDTLTQHAPNVVVRQSTMQKQKNEKM